MGKPGHQGINRCSQGLPAGRQQGCEPVRVLASLALPLSLTALSPTWWLLLSPALQVGVPRAPSAAPGRGTSTPPPASLELEWVHICASALDYILGCQACKSSGLLDIFLWGGRNLKDFFLLFLPLSSLD